MKKDTTDLGKFPLGLDNVSPDTDLPEGALTEANNVILDKEGNVLRRKGYTKIVSGNNIHSIFDGYFAEGTTLRDIEGNQYYQNLNPSRFLAWEKIFGLHYFSDGAVLRTVENGNAGLPTPPNNPILTATSGLLSAGTYQVTICYRHPVTGEVGGAKLASVINVGDAGGITLSSIPVSPDGYDVVVFCTTQNGTALYWHDVVQNGVTSFTITDSRESVRMLDTQFMEPLPGGSIIRHFKARLYVAHGSQLWFSEAARYGLRKTNKDFFSFPSNITIVQPVEDGIFVVSDKTYFLAGTEPKDMRLVVISPDSGIEGTGISVSSGSFGIDGDLQLGYWFSDKGAVLGLPSGELKQITDDRLALEEGIQYGATLFREIAGVRQLITSFTDRGKQSSGFKFGAQATATVIRNGVVVP